MTMAEAIDRACVYCIEHDVLRQFLLKNRSEVVKVLLTEFDEKKYIKMEIVEGFHITEQQALDYIEKYCR